LSKFQFVQKLLLQSTRDALFSYRPVKAWERKTAAAADTHTPHRKPANGFAMKTRPTIFISGVSHEFGSFRDAVENEIEKKGCFAENQTGFSPDYGAVEEMLRRRLHDSDAVIHIAGFRFGAEPNQRPANALRRSYTQMEFDIARELQKPVYGFLSTEPSVRQPPKPDEQPEDAEAEQSYP
jgi:hypothetical protein